MFRVVSGFENATAKDLKEDISFLFTILNESVPDTIDDIYLRIVDEQSAIRYKTFYDKQWFLHQLISTDCKVKIATVLKNICSKYGIESTLWNAIVDMEPSVISAIDILENKNALLKSKEG